MADKLHGRAIAVNSIAINRINEKLTAQLFDATIQNYLNDGGRPIVSNLRYFGANTTANINGGQTITLTGRNFAPNVQIYVNNTATPSVTRTNANSVSFVTAAQSAGTYLVYAINPDGGFGIVVPGIVYA